MYPLGTVPQSSQHTHGNLGLTGPGLGQPAAQQRAFRDCTEHSTAHADRLVAYLTALQQSHMQCRIALYEITFMRSKSD
jgi:hypothetical protein